MNKEAIKNMILSEWWRELKKIIEDKKYKMSLLLIDRYWKDDNIESNFHDEILKIQHFEEFLKIPENIIKEEEFKKDELNSLEWDINWLL